MDYSFTANYILDILSRSKKLIIIFLCLFFLKGLLNFSFSLQARILLALTVNYALSIAFTGEKTVYIVHTYT